MNIEFKKLYAILEKKTNRAIGMLDELKCTTPEYKNVLSSIVNNLESLKKLKEFDLDCPECKTNEERPIIQEDFKPTERQRQLEQRQSNNPGSAIGKKWVTFKGGK